MKKLFLLLLLLTVSIITCAQDNYYWSAGKKNYIRVDTGVFVVKYKQNFKISNVKAALLGKYGIKNITPFRNNLGIINADKKSRLTTEKLKADSTIEDAMPAYRFGNLPFYLTGEILLQPKPGVSIEQLLKLIDNHATIKSKSKYNTYVLEVDNWNKLPEYANRLYMSGLVKYSHPNFVAPIEVTTDPLYSNQYYLNNTGQFGGTLGIDIDAPGAWNITEGNPDVRVAVIDDGVETHEELTERVLTGYTPQISSSNPDTHGQPNANDPPGSPFGHGECCAGIIAASHNDIGIRGIAPNVKIVPVNIFNDWYINNDTLYYHEDANDLAVAIDWAWDDGQADVLSDSWGYRTTNSGSVPNADNIIAAIGRARTQGRNGLGSVVVFASGNYNQNFSGVTFPANVDSVITVGAIDKNGNIWNYSSRGPTMDLVAPSGGNPGDIYTIDRMGSKGFSTGNYYYNFNGTSAACPQVAGVVALMLSVDSSLTESNVHTILQETARDLGTPGFDDTYGYGLVDAYAAVYKSGGFVTGPSCVCTSNTIFTLNNPPPGTTVSWIQSSNLSYISGQGTDNYTVQPANSSISGMGWVKAIASSLWVTDTIEKQVWIGVPVTPLIQCPYTEVEPNSTIEAVGLSPGAENYNWTVAGGTITSGQGTSDIWIQTASGIPVCPVDLTIRLTTSNACGNSAQAVKSIPFDCSGGGGGVTPLSVSPNPADNILTIEINNNKTPDDLINIDSKTSELHVYDKMMNLKMKKRFSGTKTKINVRNLKQGVYILQIISGNKIFKKEIMVSHH